MNSEILPPWPCSLPCRQSLTSFTIVLYRVVQRSFSSSDISSASTTVILWLILSLLNILFPALTDWRDVWKIVLYILKKEYKKNTYLTYFCGHEHSSNFLANCRQHNHIIILNNFYKQNKNYYFFYIVQSFKETVKNKLITQGSFWSYPASAIKPTKYF